LVDLCIMGCGDSKEATAPSNKPTARTTSKPAPKPTATPVPEPAPTLLQNRSARPVIGTKDSFMVPNVELRDHDGGVAKFVDWTYKQDQGTCSSHAICGALGYVWNRQGFHPYYLHKHSQFRWRQEQTYDVGVTVQQAMSYVQDIGIPVQLPTFSRNSGGAFPSGTQKYGFQQVFDVMVRYTDDTLSGKIIRGLKEFKHPVVVSMFSSSSEAGLRIKESMGTASLADDISNNTCISNNTHISKDNVKQDQNRKSHAMLVYGFKEDNDGNKQFYIKNSWGNGSWAEAGEKITKGGNCIMPAAYLDEFGFGAMIGIGQADLGSSDYKREDKPDGHVMFIATSEVPVFRSKDINGAELRTLKKGEMILLWKHGKFGHDDQVARAVKFTGYIDLDDYHAGRMATVG